MTPEVTAALKKTLSVDDPLMRQAAIEFLGIFATRAGVAVASMTPTLIRSLKDNDPDVRSLAASALGDIDPTDERVVPALIEILADFDSTVRRNAAVSLGKMGIKAKAALPKLTDLLEDF